MDFFNKQQKREFYSNNHQELEDDYVSGKLGNELVKSHTVDKKGEYKQYAKFK